MRHIALSIMLAILLLPLAACGAGAGTQQPPPGDDTTMASVDFVPGTYWSDANPDLVRAGFGVWFDMGAEAVPPGGATLRIFGPFSWNQGMPRVINVSAAVLEAGFGLTAPDQPGVVGNYSMELDLGGGNVVQAGPKPLMSLSTIAFPTGLEVTAFSSNSVTAQWDDHPDAVSYTVALRRAPNVEIALAFVHDSAVTFDGLSLEPGLYRVVLEANSFDRLGDPPPKPLRVDRAQVRSDPFEID